MAKVRCIMAETCEKYSSVEHWDDADQFMDDAVKGGVAEVRAALEASLRG